MTTTRSNRRQQNHNATPAAQGGRNQLIIYCLIFVIGFVSGVAFSVYKGNISVPGQDQASSGQAGSHNEEIHQAILGLEAEVTKNPQNYEAWTRLGNLYYDSQQADKAIAAYNKSLELHKGDANIITDLGVMYRLANQPQKAIEMFDRAIRENPAHLPSRYNKGIVLMYDLGDQQGAIASWEEILKIDPQAKAGTGESIRDMIDKLKNEQAAK